MRMEVSEYEKTYSFELEPVTQLCGQNLVKKTYVLESIKKYFSTYKYAELQNKWRDNIRIDDELVGRKFFTVLSIGSFADLLTMIKWSKQSLMTEYVKQLMLKFDWQLHLRTINEELEEMFQILNSDIRNLGDVELTYAMSDVWDMVQKTSISGYEQTVLEDKDNYELIMIFLNLIQQVMISSPKKMLIIMNNIDHLVSKAEYAEIVDKIQSIGVKFDIFFILSISMDGYVVCQKEICSGIVIFGDVDFQMPEWEKILNYILDNYPCNKTIPEDQMRKDLEKIIQKIGRQDFLYSVEEEVICKLINTTLLLHEKWEDAERLPELAFLKS